MLQADTPRPFTSCNIGQGELAKMLNRALESDDQNGFSSVSVALGGISEPQLSHLYNEGHSAYFTGRQ